MKKNWRLICVLLLFCNLKVTCQEKKLQKINVKENLLVILPDTAFVTKRDTTLLLSAKEIKRVRFRPNPYQKSSLFYDSLSKKFGAQTLGRDILDLVVKSKKRKKKLVSAIVKSEDIFKPFSGLTIGSIVFKRVDLIEGSVIDTLQKASSNFGKFINRVHIDTRVTIIQQNLLFAVGDKVNPYELADNERILRQLKILRDVRIYVKVSKTDPNLVDVTVTTQDVGSFGISGSYGSLKNYRIDVYDINVLGYAKQFKVSYFRNAFENPKNGYALALREANILKTFIKGKVEHTDNSKRRRTSLSLSRDFFTPEIKYAGGLSVYQTNEIYFYEAYDTLKTHYKERNMDFWVGRSFQISNRTNLIFTAGVNPRDFTIVSLSDSNQYFHDRTIFLGGTTLTKRNFIKSLRIQGFGRTEDIPIGHSIGIVFGREINEFSDRSYAEVNGTFANYFNKAGYINISLALGSYYKQSYTEDGLIAIAGTYFSELIKVSRLQLRQFIYFSYLKGFNRNLDRTVGIEGKWETADALKPLGIERTTLGVESVYFMPWYTYGFQFALYHRIDLNLLSVYSGFLSQKMLFPSIKLGVRMFNENLVLPSFSMEVSYYGGRGQFREVFDFRISVTIPDLFQINQTFKPKVHTFK